MQKVLIVEDDADISAVVAFNFRNEGFQATVTDRGARALRLLRENGADLVILDLMLSDISGLEVCRAVRADSQFSLTPILMLTARGQEHERLEGLEQGADDYIVKPFSIREVILRAKAILRRTVPVEAERGAHLGEGAIIVDTAAHRVFVGGAEILLTHTEYRLLTLFLRRPGRVFSRRQLLDQVWNMPGNVVTRTVDTHVKRLREKLGPMGGAIETVRSVGYRFMY